MHKDEVALLLELEAEVQRDALVWVKDGQLTSYGHRLRPVLEQYSQNIAHAVYVVAGVTPPSQPTLLRRVNSGLGRANLSAKTAVAVAQSLQATEVGEDALLQTPPQQASPEVRGYLERFHKDATAARRGIDDRFLLPVRYDDGVPVPGVFELAKGIVADPRLSRPSQLQRWLDIVHEYRENLEQARTDVINGRPTAEVTAIDRELARLAQWSPAQRQSAARDRQGIERLSIVRSVRAERAARRELRREELVNLRTEEVEYGEADRPASVQRLTDRITEATEIEVALTGLVVSYTAEVVARAAATDTGSSLGPR